MQNYVEVKTKRDVRKILVDAGYSRHTKGYIKKIGKGKSRYHALTFKGGLAMHVDKTVGWKHVSGSTYPIKGELRKIGFTDDEIISNYK